MFVLKAGGQDLRGKKWCWEGVKRREKSRIRGIIQGQGTVLGHVMEACQKTVQLCLFRDLKLQRAICNDRISLL